MVCAQCKSKVDPGMVRCPSCEAALSSPASLVQVIGWVLIALSSMPIGLGVVAEGAQNHLPLISGVSVLGIGIVAMLTGRTKAKAMDKTVLPDEAVEQATA